MKFTCVGMTAVCNAVVHFTMSCCAPEIFAIRSRNCLKSHQNFDVFGPPKFSEEGGGVAEGGLYLGYGGSSYLQRFERIRGLDGEGWD